MSGSDYWGDLGDEMADKLLKEQLAVVNEDKDESESEERRVLGLEKAGLFSRLEFKWKSDDRLILDRIRMACNTVTAREYQVIQKTLDDLYEGIRVPELNKQGNPVMDDKGRLVWKRDENGRLLEDWSRLDGMDLEVAIFHLQKSRIELAARTNELLQEAIFAKHIFNDEYYEGYRSLVEGTQGDRTAQANRATREEKYFSFYRFCLWQSADTLLKEIVGLQRVMERIRDWRVWGDRRKNS